MQYSVTPWPPLAPSHVWATENRGARSRHARHTSATASREALFQTRLNRDTAGLRKSPREDGYGRRSCLQGLLQREGQARLRWNLYALAFRKHLGSGANGG